HQRMRPSRCIGPQRNTGRARRYGSPNWAIVPGSSVRQTYRAQSRPTRLAAAADRLPDRLSIGIDIGGTNVAGGVVDEDGQILADATRATPGTDPASVLDVIADITEELRAQHHVLAIGIGAAGFVDASQSTVVFSPHLA